MSGNDQLISIISALPSAIAVVDKEMRYMAASKKWIEDYGLQGKKILGESHYTLFPEIESGWKAIHADCLRGKAQKNPKDKFVRLDGTVQWLDWEINPWYDSKGDILGMIMCTVDITERVEHEHRLKRSVDLFSETNQAAGIGSWEFDVGSNKAFWSPMIRHIYEVSEDFRPETEMVKAFYRREADCQLMESVMHDALNEGKSFDIDQEITTARGHQKWIRVRGNPKVEDGKCIRVSGTIQDIQEIKLQSLLLRDSEEKYKSIIENSLNAHFLIRPDGYIIEANKAGLDMFGYTIDEMRSLGRADLMNISDPNLAPYLSTRDRTGAAKAELTGIRKNGELFPHEISSVSFTNSDGVLRTSVSMVDITERRKAEENLRLSEAEFRAAFEYSALGMSLMSIQGKWIRVNESFCRILGYTNRELMSRSLKELSYPDDQDKEVPLMEEVLKGLRKSYHLEKRYLHKNGTIVWVHQASSVVTDIDYKPSHWTLQIQDITEQKNIENVLREERELLRTVIDNIPASIFIKDLQSRKLLVNRFEWEYMGVADESELIGKDDYELFPTSLARVTIAEDQEVFTTGKPIMDREKVVIWSDGSMRSLMTSKIPLYDKGRISGLLGITHDVTRFKEAESALFESEQKYRRIFENVQDVFYQTDPAGIVTEISPSIEKHSGYPREFVIGKPVTDFYYNLEDREGLVQTIRADRAVSDFEVRLRTIAGEKKYASVNAQLIIRNGEVVGTEGSMRDVTERKLQEDSLKQLNSDLNILNEQKNKLLSVIAHDLRNPISGCVGLLEIVFTEIDQITKRELVEYMTMMQKGVRNAHELLEDLLEWARIQFHSVDFIPSKIDDLANELHHTLTKLEPLADAKQIVLSNYISDNISIMADKHMLASIIRNLVTNAIKFTNKGGHVCISVERKVDGYLFAIKDDGIGISPEDIDKLFSDDTGFTSYGTLGEKGTGMGLGLCKNFVEKHGGKIWVDSQKGSGSTFYFNIPDQN